jgi:molecular chaperone GrpE
MHNLRRRIQLSLKTDEMVSVGRSTRKDDLSENENMDGKRSAKSPEHDASGDTGKEITSSDAKNGQAERLRRSRTSGAGAEDSRSKERKEKSAKGDAPDKSVHKSTRRASRKELLELIQRKNEMLEKMKNMLDESEQDIKIKEDKILRMAAEFENFKKRTRREWELLQKNANAELITEILGVLDDFERALDAMGEANDQFQNGVKLIYSGLFDVLSRAGLKRIEAQGQCFNPQYHEAIGETESEEVDEGCVAHVIQKGYLLHGQLLRPARVIVAKKKTDT